jgi:hypothetical protein
VKIIIIKKPTGILEGVALDHYRVGQVYDVPASLANYLVADRFAMFESRDASHQEARTPDRRRRT